MPNIGGTAASKSGYKARYVSWTTAPVGTSTLPQGSLYAVASTGFSLLEAHFLRSGAAALIQARLTRLNSLGTPGATVGVGKYDDDAPAALCLPKDTHTVAPTLGDQMHALVLPTSAGTGAMYAFHDDPIEVAIGTANGIGWLPVTPSGAADVSFVWEE